MVNIYSDTEIYLYVHLFRHCYSFTLIKAIQVDHYLMATIARQCDVIAYFHAHQILRYQAPCGSGASK